MFAKRSTFRETTSICLCVFMASVRACTTILALCLNPYWYLSTDCVVALDDAFFIESLVVSVMQYRIVEYFVGNPNSNGGTAVFIAVGPASDTSDARGLGFSSCPVADFIKAYTAY